MTPALETTNFSESLAPAKPRSPSSKSTRFCKVSDARKRCQRDNWISWEGGVDGGGRNVGFPVVALFYVVFSWELDMIMMVMNK